MFGFALFRQRPILTLCSAALLSSAGVSPARAQAGTNDTSTGTITLAPLKVQSTAPQSPTGPGKGYVATTSNTATKSDTPIIETPQTINVVTPAEMKQQGVRSVGDALRYTPGVQDEVDGFGTRADWTQIRGFDASNAFFLDGLRTDQTNFVYKLEPYGLERIEVLKGPASVLYGENVPGGLINAISKLPTSTPHHEIQLIGGTHGDEQLNFDNSGPVEGTDGKLEYRIVGVFRKSGTQVDHTSDNRQYIAPSLTWKIDPDDTFTVLGTYLRERSAGNTTPYMPVEGSFLPNPDGEIKTSTMLGEPGFDHENYNQEAIGFQYEHRFSDVLKFDSNFRASWLQGDQQITYGECLGGYDCAADGIDNNNPSVLTSIPYKSHTSNHSIAADNRFEYLAGTGPVHHDITAGVDYRHFVSDEKDYEGDSVDINIFDPVYQTITDSDLTILDHEEETMNLTGVYAQDLMSWGGWRLLGGVRHDWATDNLRDEVSQSILSNQETQATTYRVGLVYLFNNGIAPYASYSTSFQPVSGQSLVGLPKPITGKQEEVGVKYQPPGMNAFITASLFNLVENNAKNTYTGWNPDYEGYSVQTGQERNQGLELEAKATVAPGWDVDAAYAYSNSEITKDDSGLQGQMMPLVPRHYVSVWSHYVLQKGLLKGLGLGAGWRYRSSVYYADSNGAGVAPTVYRMTPVSLFDLSADYDLGRLSTRLKGLSVQANATNLGDVKYIAACLDAEDCYWGERRSVYVTLSYDW